MANPGKASRKALKWILRYINGSLNIVLIYGGACGDNCNTPILFNNQLSICDLFDLIDLIDLIA